MAPHRPAAAGPPARIRILDVAPVSQPGDRPRALCDAWVEVEATLARDGDEQVFGMLRYRRAGRRRWLLAPLHPLDDGRVTGAFVPDEPGLWEVQLDAWVNHWSAWRDEITRKVESYGQPDYSAEIAAGCALLQPHTGNPAIAETLEIVASCEPGSVVALVALLGVTALPDRQELVSLPRPLLVAVDPAEAGRGAWVQLPPRASGCGASGWRTWPTGPAAGTSAALWRFGSRRWPNTAPWRGFWRANAANAMPPTCATWSSCAMPRTAPIAMARQVWRIGCALNAPRCRRNRACAWRATLPPCKS